MKTNLSLLGSTGSIGTQTLDVARALGLKVSALAAHSNITLLESQIREWKPKLAVVYETEAAAHLRAAVRDLPVRVLSGMEGLCEAASLPEADVVCNAVVGMVGLQPTLAAANAGKDLALANKETLAAGGALVMETVRKNGVRVFPVDSEHSAIFQCLQGCPERGALRRILLTASGGPFFGKTREELKTVTPQDALRHPNWEMGNKITIDCATMMNKGLEVIEASWLFGLPEDRIDVVVHRESIVHSLVEYVDGAMLAQLGTADMHIPIQYALTWPDRKPSVAPPLDLVRCGTLRFFAPDDETFPCLAACREALRRGGLTPAAINGANEVAVQLFLQGKLSFPAIGEIVRKMAATTIPGGSLEEILDADREARASVRQIAGMK
ncbi:1-deoxy-D-xylulose-5-phosphate reductoisomerase [Yeguia hominis]|uniref:1-deoxy-D-xylulose 5-phosphate reductoisomerase n=1 Tax=Yeguia hominis TaxID=2763662 RepID=A0A926DCD2_9FIRM|nr:1-deoxy-D-xylulose-5-phosphate reductoisomerase [Yeguia hominis]MBC8534405.1 1-deoxy-D-xylulose-5-phosphate reductoisomerase [Yeguia hominis]